MSRQYWYGHRCDDGLDMVVLCDTEADAREGADVILEGCIQDLAIYGTWPKRTESIAWGRIVDGKCVAVERATQTDVLEMCHEPRGCDCGALHGGDDEDDADEGYLPDVDYSCDYQLLPVEVGK